MVNCKSVSPEPSLRRPGRIQVGLDNFAAGRAGHRTQYET
jgi:hypothetical protein